MLLEELVGSTLMENRELEIKQRLDRENTVDWLKTVAGFANADGGVMYVGATDKEHDVIGYERREADEERNYFNNQINLHVSPRPPYTVGFIKYEIREKERYVLKIEVESSPVKPVILKYDGVPSIYIRREGFTNGATYEEIINMSIHSQSASFDTIASDQEYHFEDFKALQAFSALHREGNQLSEKALASLGFFNTDGKLANGAVLFKDHYSGCKTDIQCSLFSGFTKGSERIVSVNHFSGNITETIDYMYAYVLQRMNHTLVKRNDSHIEIDAYPKRALFEGIINAVAHRDYFLDGTQIQLDMFRDRLEISSPGSFYHGNPLPKTFDLSSIISKRRNELICGILVHCGVMEAAGTGFDKIAEEYKEADSSHKPYIFSASDQFTLVLPDLSYAEGLKDSELIQLEFPPIPGGSSYDGDILSYCYGFARTATEIAKHLGLSYSSYLKSRIIGNLVDNGYLIEKKEAKSSFYKTNPDMVRAQ